MGNINQRLCRICVFLITIIITTSCHSQPIFLAENAKSSFKICIAKDAPAIDIKAAHVFQDFFNRVTGVMLPIINDASGHKQCILIGASHQEAGGREQTALQDDGYIIKTIQNDLLIYGKGMGTLYGVYHFIDVYLGCKKWDEGPAFIPHSSSLSISANIHIQREPALKYREVYMPPSFDDEYLDWHGLHRFEISWGLWGHSFFKLVPAKKYFEHHPEYFSLVDGKRTATQLCLSNKEVLKICIDNLSAAIAENPAAVYWSVSANDNLGYCECPDCKKVDAIDGGPQGSLIYFVNAVAAKFPEKIITTLAYSYTAGATQVTRPAKNVAIMLSSIDAYRSMPLSTEVTAAEFRRNLKNWRSKTEHIFIWDYCTQFTNYLAPFPVVENFKPDVNFILKNGVTGIFMQGSGDTYSDMPELKTYILAALLWDPSTNVDSTVDEFLIGYYGKSAPIIRTYLSMLRTEVQQAKAQLDIYGNPIKDHTGYLSPENMERYSQLMNTAEALIETDKKKLQHVQELRLTQEYVYLQQAKFFGRDKHGVFTPSENGEINVRPQLADRIARFTTLALKSGVKEMSEEGISPEEYKRQWTGILTAKPRKNIAKNAVIRFEYPFSQEYINKGARTLTDETIGYDDYSYNWLCFYGVPMNATVDMKELKYVHTISMNFLEDTRHLIFRPISLGLEVSVNGIDYEPIGSQSMSEPDLEGAIQILPFTFSVNRKTRFIRLKAMNKSTLPLGFFHKTKKPMISCDELWVE